MCFRIIFNELGINAETEQDGGLKMHTLVKITWKCFIVREIACIYIYIYMHKSVQDNVYIRINLHLKAGEFLWGLFL